MRRVRSIAALVLLAALSQARPACAQGAFWDGEGGTLFWSNPANWDINNIPGPDHSVHIINAFTQLDDDFTIRTLLLRGLPNSGNVVNSPNGGATSFDLNITDDLNYFDAGGNVTVYGPSLSAGRILLNNGSSLHLNSEQAAGTAVVRANLLGPAFAPSLNNPAGGTIRGNGRIELNASIGGLTTLFNNAGTLTAGSFSPAADPPFTELQITAASANARVGLGGVVNVNPKAELEIQPRLNGPFNSTLNLARGATFRMTQDWEMNGGAINVNTEGPGAGVAGIQAALAGGDMTLTGGTIALDALDTLGFDTKLNATGGTINNAGLIVTRADAKFGQGVDFNMIGPQAKLLVFNSDLSIDSLDFDLDADAAAGNTTRIFPGGNLDLTLGPGSDKEFNHFIELLNGELDVKAGGSWGLGPGGSINATAIGALAQSVINGEAMKVTGGVINVNSGAELLVNAQTLIQDPCSIQVGFLGHLDFNVVKYAHAGATYTGQGTLSSGHAEVVAPTTFNVTTVNLDDGNVTLDSTLTINAKSIDNVDQGFGAVMTIKENARLTVNLTGGDTWNVDPGGKINITGDNADVDTFLAGSDVDVQGGIDVSGAAQIDARLAGLSGLVLVNSTGFVSLNGGSLANPNRITGGGIGGFGQLFIPGSRALHGFGGVGVPIQSSGEVRADNGVLALNSLSFYIDTLGTASASGQLAMTHPWNTNQTATVDLRGGVLSGNTITNSGLGGINGHGLVSAKVINNGAIDAENGGVLLLNNPANDNDWDGAGGGSLNASTADLELRDNASFPFTGTVIASGGHSVFANGFELEFEPSSSLVLSTGTYRTNQPTRFGGNLTVLGGGASRLQIPDLATFEAGGVTTLQDDLLLDVSAVAVLPGAQFQSAAPGASLIVNSGVLQLHQGVTSAAFAVSVENRSGVDVGSPGTLAQIGAPQLVQTASGTLYIDLGGTAPANYDRLTLTGAASLNGALNVYAINGFVPALGQMFDILLAAGGVSGVFSTVNAFSLPAGLGYQVIYHPTLVRLQVVSTSGFSADFDDDGDVDGADLTRWRNSFRINANADADNDGDSDGADFLAWQRQLGSGLAVPAGASVPEPASLVLVASLLGVAIAVHRRWLMVS